MKSNRLFIFLFTFFCLSLFSQTSQSKTKLRIAVLSSLYLDSLYPHGDNSEPRITSFDNSLKLEWDFYFGFKMASDSLSKLLQGTSQEIDYYYYDTKQIVNDTAQTLSEHFTAIQYDLIIGTPLRNEMALIAQFAHNHKIPFISVLFPHLIHEKEYPYHILLNPPLGTHITEMLKYIYRFNKNKIKVVCKASEDNAIILEAINKLKNSYWAKRDIIEFVNLYDSFYVHQTNALQLSAKENNNMFVLSLDPSFTERLWQQIHKHYNSYRFFIGGLPIWDNLKSIDSFKNPNLTFCFSKAFYYTEKQKNTHNMNNLYQTLFSSTPSDLYWLGYETAMTFSQKLFKYPNKYSFLAALNDTTQHTFTRFTFYSKDALLSPQKASGEFVENHHFFFIETTNGNKKIQEN